MSASRNDITLRVMASNPGTRKDREHFEQGFDRIFGQKPQKPRYVPPPIDNKDQIAPKNEIV